MAKIKKVKIKQSDGSFSNPIPLGVDATNVDIDGENLVTYLVNMNKQLQQQLTEMPTIRSGSTEPDNSIGKDGDIYIVYEKV